MKSKKIIAVILMVIQSVIYGLGDPISKSAYEVAPVFSLLVVRYSIALLALLLVFGKQIKEGLKNSHISDWILPVMCMGGAYVSNNIGLLLTQATTVAFLRSLPTIIAPLLSFLIYRKKYHKGLVAIQLAVVAGLYMLCCGRGGLGNGFGLGEAFSLLSAVLLAGTLVFAEKALEKVDPITLTGLQTFASVILASCGMLILEFSGKSVETSYEWLKTPSIFLSILYLAIMCTVLGYIMQNYALKYIEAHTVAVTQGLCPVMTAVFSMFILGEKMSLFGACGALIILAGLILALRYDQEEYKEKNKAKKQN